MNLLIKKFFKMEIELNEQNISSKKSESILNKEIGFQKAFSDKKKVSFYSELGALVNAGIDLRRALNIIEKGNSNKKDKAIISSITEQVIKGKSLSDSMQEMNVFTPYEYHSIKIGEETGKLVLVLEELERYFTQKINLKRQMVSVFSYPAFILVVTFGVIYFMLTSVVPMFSDVFNQFGSELPPLTQKIVTISNNFGLIAGTIGGFLVILILIVVTQKKEVWYRNLSSKIILKIPVFGKLARKVYLSRFCQSLNLLTSAHTPLVQALDLVKNMIAFYPMEIAIEEIRRDVLKGKLFSESMEKHAIFPDKMVSLISAAEEINYLDSILKRLAEQYQTELDHQTKVIGKILDPLMMLIIGGVVAIIMIAMYLPMFSMSQVIGE